jgi:LysR family transcriptional regulator, regulator for metE and metH
LPRWAVQNYLDRAYVAALPIGPNGLWARLHLAMRPGEREIHDEFATLLVDTAFSTLSGLQPIK